MQIKLPEGKGEKEMKLKRFISALLCTAMAGTMAVGLTSCGGENGGEGDVLLWYQLGDKPADHDMVMAEANKIIQEKLGVTLDLQYIDTASFTQKMKLKMASGEPYDLAFTGYVNSYYDAVDMGGLYDITELLEEVGMSDVVPQFYIDAASVNGKVYGIPNIQVMANPFCTSLDKSLADEIGLDAEAFTQKYYEAEAAEDKLAAYEEILAMWDEYLPKIKAARPDKFTMMPADLNAQAYETFVSSVAIKKDGSSDKLVLGFELPTARRAAEAKYKWYTEGYIRKEIASLSGEHQSDDSKRTYALHHGSNWKPGGDALYAKTFGEPGVYIMYHKPYISQQRALATMTSVGANSKNPKKAVELLKLINEDVELFNLICFGIEGTHYTKNADGTVSEIEGSGYAGIGGMAWRYGNQFNAYVMEGQDADVWEQTEKMNNEAIKSPVLGFVPDTTSIVTEMGNMSNVNAEYAGRGMGTEDPANWWDEYVADMYEAGAQKVLDEIQRQYDEWKASQK